ncbi:MAG: helix-turn-helix domain-containing protein [Deltaproteobacteria bacterium]|nr:helix-turn-helix domain-containing protein [Deltaproteobacteria bacterium]
MPKNTFAAGETGTTNQTETTATQQAAAPTAPVISITSGGGRGAGPSTGPAGTIPDPLNSLGQRGLPEILDEIEERLVAAAMARTGNNQIRAAELLRVTRGALQYKLKKFAKGPKSESEAA